MVVRYVHVGLSDICVCVLIRVVRCMCVCECVSGVCWVIRCVLNGVIS